MNKNICAVIISFEPDDKITRLVNSIINQTDEILIIDNASRSKQSLEILTKLKKEPKVSIIYNMQNYGIAKALNIGAGYAISNGYKWVLTCDQDSEFLPDTSNIILNSYEQLPDKEKVIILAPSSRERSFYTGKDKKAEKVIWKDCDIVLTSGNYIKTETFNIVGFFEEKLFIDQVDNDFCYKIRKKGYKIKIAENIIFLHEIGKSEKKLFWIVTNHPAKRKYYLARNSIYVLKRHFTYAPYKTVRYMLGGTIFAFTKVLLFENDKINKLKNIVKGITNGILNKYTNIN